MLAVSNLTKSYSTRTLFRGINFTAGPRDRIAVIGPNGCGKTTLFEIIFGNITADSGSVTRRRDTTIGYLEQDVSDHSSRGLLEDVVAASTVVSGLAHRIEVLREELADDPDPEEQAGLLNELGDLQSRYEAAGGYDTEHEARIILSGLGFAESDFARPLSEFSGGWMMRARLARLLLLRPDILMLDEPTNHLDLESAIWFENYLADYEGAVLVTSHDRAFLNRIVSRVLAFEPEGVFFRKGNYDAYVLGREQDIETQQAAARRQDTKIKQEERFIERFRYKNTKASQVQSRIKKLEKLERVVVPRSTRKVKFSFPRPPRGGLEVITLAHVEKSYGSNRVYDDLNLVLERGDRVALVGPNAAGKTTLLRILAGVLPFEGGERRLGHNVTAAYYAQHQLELLLPENDVVAELRRVAPEDSESAVRGIAGAFLFTGDDVYKKVSVLSGGERARVSLAKMLIRPANLLLMDEPTNHLDIPSREVLTDALQAYRGTLCFITHDRTMIRQLANKIIAVRDGRLIVFPGDYDSYLHWRDSGGGGTRVPAATGGASPRRQQKKQRKAAEGEIRNRYYKQSTPLRKRIKAIEPELNKLESELAEVEGGFADQEQYSSGDSVVKNIERHRALKESIQRLTAEWEQLSAETERLKREFDEATAA